MHMSYCLLRGTLVVAVVAPSRLEKSQLVESGMTQCKARHYLILLRRGSAGELSGGVLPSGSGSAG